MKKFLTTLLFFIMLTVPTLASAQTGGGEYQIDWSFFKPTPKDTSIEYLYQLFGKFGNVIHDDGGTGEDPDRLVNKMFVVFNHAILGVGALLILYSLIVSTVNTASQGEVLGKKFSTLWMPFRSALGVAVLLPLPKIGYSVLQIFVMWVIVNGVGFADRLWEKVVTELGESTSLLAPSALTPDLRVAVSDLVTSWMCTSVISRSIQRYDEKWAEHYSDLAPPRMNINRMGGQTLKENIYVTEFPYSGWVPLKENNPQQYNSNGVCGTYQVLIPQYVDAATRERVLRVTSTLIMDTKRIAQNIWNNPSHPPQFRRAMGQELDAIIAKYNTSLGNALRGLKIPGSDEKAFTDKAINRGWIFAGSYFYWIVKKTDTINAVHRELHLKPSLMIDRLVSRKTVGEDKSARGPVLGWGDTAAIRRLIASAMFRTQSLMKEYRQPTHITSQVFDEAMFKKEFVQVTQFYIPRPIAPWNDVVAIEMPTWLSEPLSTMLNSVIQIWPMLSVGLTRLWLSAMGSGDLVSMHVNPVSHLANVGGVLLHIVQGFWLFGGIGLAVFGAVWGSIGSLWGGGYGSNALVVWITPISAFALTTLATIGITLRYYLPLLPLILFSFGALGWFFAVIESIIAAPIVALGIISPEGAEFYGSAKPAIKLLTNVFIRPTLMVFGFIFAIMMTYIAFDLVNAAILPVIAEQVGSNTIFDSIILGPIGMFTIYTAFIVILLTQCFTLIHVVPNKVLRWIGGGQEQPGEIESGHQEIGKTAIDQGSTLGSKAGESAGQLADAGVQTGLTFINPGKYLGQKQQKYSDGSDAVHLSGPNKGKPIMQNTTEWIDEWIWGRQKKPTPPKDDNDNTQ